MKKAIVVCVGCNYAYGKNAACWRCPNYSRIQANWFERKSAIITIEDKKDGKKMT